MVQIANANKLFFISFALLCHRRRDAIPISRVPTFDIVFFILIWRQMWPRPYQSLYSILHTKTNAITVFMSSHSMVWNWIDIVSLMASAWNAFAFLFVSDCVPSRTNCCRSKWKIKRWTKCRNQRPNIIDQISYVHAHNTQNTLLHSNVWGNKPYNNHCVCDKAYQSKQKNRKSQKQKKNTRRQTQITAFDAVNVPHPRLTIEAKQHSSPLLHGPLFHTAKYSRAEQSTHTHCAPFCLYIFFCLFVHDALARLTESCYGTYCAVVVPHRPNWCKGKNVEAQRRAALERHGMGFVFALRFVRQTFILKIGAGERW